MSMTRRRFLTISAAFAAAPGVARAHSWQGRAFGAEVSLTIRAEADHAKDVLRDARQMLRDIEGLFSLYDSGSELSRLNATGELFAPDPRFVELMRAADHAHNLTGGLFDPSVQPLWHVFGANLKPHEFYDLVDWEQVTFDDGRVALGPRQALTFNGIAQGYATDKVTELLVAHGFRDVLVNIGEHRGVGGPWTLGLHDPEHGPLGTRTITTGAIATSSPLATPLGHAGHIMHRTAQPQWSTVSVEARSATLADSLSTALVLAPLDQVCAIRESAGVSRVTLVDFEGDLVTL